MNKKTLCLLFMSIWSDFNNSLTKSQQRDFFRENPTMKWIDCSQEDLIVHITNAGYYYLQSVLAKVLKELTERVTWYKDVNSELNKLIKE